MGNECPADVGRRYAVGVLQKFGRLSHTSYPLLHNVRSHSSICNVSHWVFGLDGPHHCRDIKGHCLPTCAAFWLNFVYQKSSNLKNQKKYKPSWSKPILPTTAIAIFKKEKKCNGFLSNYTTGSFGRMRNAVGAHATGEYFHSFFDRNIKNISFMSF